MDPITAFQSLQETTALTEPQSSSAHALRLKATRILQLHKALNPPPRSADLQSAPTSQEPEEITDIRASMQPDVIRAEITTLLRTLAWPVKLAPSSPSSDIRPPTSETPLTLTLEKEDLITRLWLQDSWNTELDRRWISDAKAVFYCACHGPETFRRYYSSLPNQLIAVHDFYRAQITNDQERDLMALVCDALWEGHRVNMAVAAPAPYGAHESGN